VAPVSRWRFRHPRERGQEFLVDRVGDQFVVNGTVSLPDQVRERLPLADAHTVSSLDQFNEVMARLHVPALESLAVEIEDAQRAVVESYGDVARLLADLAADAVAVVEPTRAKMYDGDPLREGLRSGDGRPRNRPKPKNASGRSSTSSSLQRRSSCRPSVPTTGGTPERSPTPTSRPTTRYWRPPSTENRALRESAAPFSGAELFLGHAHDQRVVHVPQVVLRDGVAGPRDEHRFDEPGRRLELLVALLDTIYLEETVRFLRLYLVVPDSGGKVTGEPLCLADRRFEGRTPSR